MGRLSDDGALSLLDNLTADLAVAKGIIQFGDGHGD
jgi:hypothetical protein